MKTNSININEITKFTPEIYENIKFLLSQLTSADIEFSPKDLKRIVDSKSSILLGATEKSDDKKIVGILTLVILDIPTCKLARIEDVVVDANYRGKGIGEMITKASIEKAKQVGVKKIDLTSNPTREVANRLYKRLGFVLRNTNVYRYQL